MSTKRSLACGLALIGLIGSGLAAHGQVLGIATSQSGATPAIGNTIATTVSQNSKLQMRTQGLVSTGQYAPRVNDGQIEFGVANIAETTYVVDGDKEFGGRPNPKLRLVTNLFALPVTFFVPASSTVQKAEDLKGKRVPTGWTSQKLGEKLFAGYFANVGVPYDSVAGVPVTAMPRMWDMFGQGHLDLTFAILGSAFTQELSQRVGGIRYLPLNTDAAAIERMRKFLPQSYLAEEKHPQTGEAIQGIAYDFVLFTNDKASDETVYTIVKTLYDNTDKMTAASAYFKRFDKAQMGKNLGIEYHPGAIKFYKEAGIWPSDK